MQHANQNGILRMLMGCAFLYLLGSSPAFAAPWLITHLQGHAESRPTTTAQWQTLSQGQQLDPPFQLRTHAKSRIELAANGDVIKASPNTELFFPAPATQEPGIFTRIFQAVGVALYQVEPRPDPRFEVTTPHLVSTVKGTRFEISATTDKTAVSLIKGLLAVNATAGGETLLLRPGQTAVVGNQQTTIELITLQRIGTAGMTATLESSPDSLFQLEHFSWADQLGIVTSTTTAQEAVAGLDLAAIIRNTPTDILDSLSGTQLIETTAGIASGSLATVGNTVGNSLGDVGNSLGDVGNSLGNVGNIIGATSSLAGDSGLGTTPSSLINLGVGDSSLTSTVGDSLGDILQLPIPGL